MRVRNRAHLPNDVSKRVLLRYHIIQISPFADHFLNPLRAQVVRESHSIRVAIRLHLEDEITYVTKAEATMPARVRQEVIRLAVMSIPRLPPLVPMDRGPPASEIIQELKRVEVVLQLEVKNRRDVITPSQ